jgi:hypothetical protein
MTLAGIRATHQKGEDMSKLKQPLRVWHGVLAIVAALAVGAAGTAIAGGGQSKDLTTAGTPPGGVFRDSGKYHYGFKAKGTPIGDSQENVRLKCPRGTRAIAGGGGGFSLDPTEQFVNYQRPFDSRDRGRVPEDGWIVFVNTIQGDGEGIGVEVVCVDKH